MPKISELSAITSVTSDDLVMVVNDPSGSPSTNKITVGNFANSVTTQLRSANTTSAGVIKVGSQLTVNSTGYMSASVLPETNRTEGYILTWDVESNNAVWQTFSGVYDYTFQNQSNTYTATSDDVLIFVDPANVGEDVTVRLPVNVGTGKFYQVKNIDPNGGYSVIVAAQGGANVIESPVTGNFINSYTITNRGDAEQWVFDGTYYRHFGSQATIPYFAAESNTFTQIVLQNQSAGNNASGDIVVYNNEGTPLEGTGPFIDMGINSNTYSNTFYSIGGPSDSYIFNDGGDLAIGTNTPGKVLIFHTGGTTANTENMRIGANGVRVNTATILAKTSLYGANNNNVNGANYSSSATRIDINKSLNYLDVNAEADYMFYLPSGQDGQVMRLACGSAGGNTVWVQSIGVWIDAARSVRHGNLANVYILPFTNNGNNTSSFVSAVYVDGRWNFDIDNWELP